MKKINALLLTLAASIACGAATGASLISKDALVEANAVVPTTKTEDATIVTIEDASSWLFRTLHIYGVSFVDGSGYDSTAFENYLTVYYGEQISSWDYEGTTRGWARNGSYQDYFVCDGSSTTSHSFEFPWWVQGLSFQAVNSGNWLPSDGYTISSSWGYHGTIAATITSGTFESTKTDGTTYAFPAVTITKEAVNYKTKAVISGEETTETTVVFNNYPNGSDTPSHTDIDGYYFGGWYTDADLTEAFTKKVYSSNATIYGKYVPNFDADTYYIVGSERGWEDVETADVFTKVSDTQYKIEYISFIENEEWKIKKGNDGWIDLSYYANDDIFPSCMTKGSNVVVTAEGANWNYDIYINLNDDSSIKEVWVSYYYNAERFCDALLDLTDDICADNQGHNGEALKPVWNTLYGYFNLGPACEQAKLRALISDEGGTTTQKAAYRYDYICTLYTTQLEQDPKTYDYNFIGRDLSSFSPAKSSVSPLLGANENKTTMIALITVIAVVAVSGIAATTFLKKKEEK